MWNEVMWRVLKIVIPGPYTLMIMMQRWDEHIQTFWKKPNFKDVEF